MASNATDTADLQQAAAKKRLLQPTVPTLLLLLLLSTAPQTHLFGSTMLEWFLNFLMKLKM